MAHPTRRDVGLRLGSLGLGATFLAPSSPARAATAPLAALAARAHILYGAAASAPTLTDPAYGALYRRETAILTTDTALKFDFLRPSREEFDFGPADALADFATEANLALRGHTLFWNENAPDWLKRLSRTEIAREFDRHLETVVARYKGRLHSWDVVNEPFWPDHGEPGGFRSGPWLAALGPGYVARALTRVRAIDPDVKLCINEAHCEILDGWGAAIRPRLLALVDDLRQRGVPLDAVGLQGHLQPQKPHDDAAFAAFVRDLARRDVDIYITELDVNDEGFPADIATRDAMVAARMRAFLDQVLRIERVKVVVSWELSDRYSGAVLATQARDPGARRLPRPLPFDAAFTRKPAADALAGAFVVKVR